MKITFRQTDMGLAVIAISANMRVPTEEEFMKLAMCLGTTYQVDDTVTWQCAREGFSIIVDVHVHAVHSIEGTIDENTTVSRALHGLRDGRYVEPD